MSSIDMVQFPRTTAPDPVLLESDAELLHSFVAEQKDFAFEELVRRHGPMVMGVCRRVLPARQDAEDAYQTTFLLLVQKSAAIDRPERLANWLFGVAHRVAGRIRTKSRKMEHLQMQLLEPPTEDNTVEVARREMRSVVDEELHRLPAKYRLPLILCYLEGKTHVEAARELGWPSGSMSSRLTKAREKLRRRLARRGLAFTSALVGMLLRDTAYGANFPSLMQNTPRAASVYSGGKASVADVVSAPVKQQLAETSKRMLVAKVRDVTVLVLLLLLLLGSAGNAVNAMYGEGKMIPDPFTWIVQSLTRSADEATTDVRGAGTEAPPIATPSSCSQH